MSEGQVSKATLRGRRAPLVAYRTKLGRMYWGYSEEVLTGRTLKRYRGKAQLVFTSPPFPLNRKKKYGNLHGEEYVKWLSAFAPLLTDHLKPDGSIVIELGNAWEPGSPTMSTLTLEALLAFKRAASLHLCQEFICFNPARLPSPAQWVNVERCRVKDAFTRIWWMSPSERPKADNRKVLQDYTESMQRLLKHGRYNSGKRPSEHHIGKDSFLTNNGGAIPPNVLLFPDDFVADLLTISNTRANDPYQIFCRQRGLEAHPARMPLKLAEFFIKFLTDRKDTVLDPFGGSNTTGRVAETLGRKWLCIEADPTYIESSKGRFAPEEFKFQIKATHPSPV